MEEEEFELTVHGRQLQARLTRLAAGRGGTRAHPRRHHRARARAARARVGRDGAAGGARDQESAHARFGSACSTSSARTPTRARTSTRFWRRTRSAFWRRSIGSTRSRAGSAATEWGRRSCRRAEPLDVSAIVRDVVELERLGEGSVDWRTDGIDDAVMALRARGRAARGDAQSARECALRGRHVGGGARGRCGGARGDRGARQWQRNSRGRAGAAVRAAFLHAHARERAGTWRSAGGSWRAGAGRSRWRAWKGRERPCASCSAGALTELS